MNNNFPMSCPACFTVLDELYQSLDLVVGTEPDQAGSKVVASDRHRVPDASHSVQGFVAVVAFQVHAEPRLAPGLIESGVEAGCRHRITEC